MENYVRRTQMGPWVKPTPGNVPERREHLFKMFWKDDTVEAHRGFSLADALTKAGYGEGAMKDVILWYKVPEPLPGFDPETYGILLKKNPKEDWEKYNEELDDRESTEALARGFVNKFGYIAAMVYEVSTEFSVYLALP